MPKGGCILGGGDLVGGGGLTSKVAAVKLVAAA